ncbi:helix-turn-helix transcriptional regulator [Propionibacterium freudenreichii]|uniref:helix-turn-helix transcriptional regulator n=1 Tax=Propionibacterium freudenreichii TaxID=1744 RepID=UPI0039E0D827
MLLRRYDTTGHPWSIAELAQVAHLSGSHLMRLFTEEIGMAPIEWLTRRRVQEMAHLLRETRLSILEIARQVGWRDRGHASEQFKRFTGTTPAQYRAQQDKPSERHCLWCGQPIPVGDTGAEIGDHRELGGDAIM